VTAAAVEQSKGVLSLLRAAQAAAVRPMDSGPRINFALSAGPVGQVPSASIPSPLDLLSVGPSLFSVGAECIGSGRDTLGDTATGSAVSFQAGGEGGRGAVGAAPILSIPVCKIYSHCLGLGDLGFSRGDTARTHSCTVPNQQKKRRGARL
jgi:hypothetical protein